MVRVTTAMQWSWTRNVHQITENFPENHLSLTTDEQILKSPGIDPEHMFCQDASLVTVRCRSR